MSRPYEKKLEQVIYTLLNSGIAAEDNRLLKTSKIATKKLILMVTGNRGLCGGYNTNVIDNTISFKDTLKAEDDSDVLLHVIGKKGINFFKFINMAMYAFGINPEDKISFSDAEKLGQGLIDQFKSEKVKEVYISYTQVVSSATYKPTIVKLLPLSIEDIEKDISDEDKRKLRSRYIFEPDPAAMLSSLLPQYIILKLYISLLESGYAEQNARRVAMKNATDAANDMVRNLTVKYNRARQAKITNEIAEIVGGAAALE